MRTSLKLGGLGLLAAAVAAGGACSSSSSPASPPPPASFGVGAFTIQVGTTTANLSVLAPGGAPLLQGIDSSTAVGTPWSMNDDAPPLTGFAIRDLATTVKMQYGSFAQTDDTTQPWKVVTRASVAGNGVDLFTGDGTRVASIAFSRGDEDQHLVASITPGDGAPPVDAGPTAKRRRISWGFACDATDHFAGFGAQTWGMDARGETIPIWVQEEGIGKDLTTDDPTGLWYIVGRRHSAYMPLPEFLSRRGFFAVADNTQRSTFALCSESSTVARMELELPVTLNVFYGPDLHDAVSRATAHFGRPRVPPAFAFAPWNDAIYGSANVRRVATKLRQVGAPSSVIWTEDWEGGTQDGDNYSLSGQWEVDRTLYPDFESVAADLHAGGFKWLVYFRSHVEKSTNAFPEAEAGGYLIKQADGSTYLFQDATFQDTSLVDLTNPAAVNWAVGKMSAAIALGADGWMGDYGEWLPTDAVLQGGSGLDLHNAYPVLWQKAVRQALDTAIAADGVERLAFERSGWLGSAPLIDVFWAGDQRTDFEVDDGLPTILPIGTGVSLAGVSTFGSDIAGYQSATNPTSTKELFFRWTELGAFSPVMRTHHGTEPMLEWSWESDDDSTAHWVRYAKQHMALAPYLRGLAQAAHDTGIGIWRPLGLEFPDDDASWPVSDEIMVGGGGLLVAPVQKMGATSRSVYLPPGTWFPWSGGQSLPGPANLTAQAPMTEIPVYARAGTIVPTYPDGVETLTVEPSLAPNASFAGDDRIVYVFTGASGQFTEAPDAGGLSYTQSVAPMGPPTWNGAPLTECDASLDAPCIVQTPGMDTVHATGNGTLVADGATFVASGAWSTRKLTVIMRY